MGGKVATAVTAVVVGAVVAGSSSSSADDPATVESTPTAASPSPTEPSSPVVTTPSPSPAVTPSPAAPLPSPSATARASAPRGDDALVLRTDRVVGVVDGDTVDLADGTRVRLAIVDTPEVHNGPEACGAEASAFTRDFVLGEEVVVLRPSTAPVTDPFGRLVGEVVRSGDRASLNVALAAAGLGTPDDRYAHEDPDLAERARAAVADAPTPDCAPMAAPPTSSPSPTPSSSPPSTGGAHTGRTDGGWSCHGAYRECLPATSGDLDCADVGHQVVLLGVDDPWRLDGNSTTRTDGVGCETWPAWSAEATYPYD